MYQEFVQYDDHQHLNSTRWITFTEFVEHLGRAGVAQVDETEEGLFVAWIDDNQGVLEKQVLTGTHSRDPELTVRSVQCRRLRR